MQNTRKLYIKNLIKKSKYRMTKNDWLCVALFIFAMVLLALGNFKH